MNSGWESVRLGNVCRLINGRAYKKPELLENGKYPVLRVGNFFTNRSWYYSDLELDADKYCDDGDLLYAWSASFGPRIWQGGKVIYHYHIWKTDIDCSRLEKEFLFYWFDWDKEKIKAEQGAGTTMIHVTKGSMESRNLLLPPLPEQKRIVAILDEAFAAIDTAVANTEKNLANARELFESYLNGVFTRKGDGWVEKTLGGMCERITKGSSPKWQGIEYVNEPGVLFVTSENVGCNQMLFNKTKYVEEAFNQKGPKSILRRGDVLTNIVGASIGRTAVFDRDVLANINQAVCLLRCEPDELMNTYLAYLLNSPFFRQILHDNEIDNARANLSLGFFKGLSVPVPSIETQITIVAKIDKYRDQTQRLESIYQQKLTTLAELKQSILQKAFAGELTTQPETEAEEAVT